MKVKPHYDYVLLGVGTRLDKNRVYDAEIATNQPNHQELGLVFVDGILLNKEEYEVVNSDSDLPSI